MTFFAISCENNAFYFYRTYFQKDLCQGDSFLPK